MSAGKFERGRYQATVDTTAIHPIRVQPETKALTIDGVANAYPSGTVNAYPSARVQGGRRELGLVARRVSVAFTGTPPTGYEARSSISLPWFNATTFNAISRGQVGTYLGAPIEVVGKSPENAN